MNVNIFLSGLLPAGTKAIAVRRGPAVAKSVERIEHVVDNDVPILDGLDAAGRRRWLSRLRQRKFRAKKGAAEAANAAKRANRARLRAAGGAANKANLDKERRSAAARRARRAGGASGRSAVVDLTGEALPVVVAADDGDDGLALPDLVYQTTEIITTTVHRRVVHSAHKTGPFTKADPSDPVVPIINIGEGRAAVVKEEPQLVEVDVMSEGSDGVESEEEEVGGYSGDSGDSGYSGNDWSPHHTTSTDCYSSSSDVDSSDGATAPSQSQAGSSPSTFKSSDCDARSIQSDSDSSMFKATSELLSGPDAAF